MSVFQEAFADLERRQAGGPAWAAKARREAYEAFATAGLPNRKDEAWKYTSLRPLTDRTFRLPQGGGTVDTRLLVDLVRKDEPTLVFVDGVLSTALSTPALLPKGVRLVPVSESSRAETGSLIDPAHLGMPSLGSPFERLSRAFYGQTGLSLEVAASVKVGQAVHIAHVATEKGAEGATFPRHRIQVGEGAEVCVIESFVGPADVAYFVAPVTEIAVARGAQVHHARIQADGAKALHFAASRAVLAADARFTSFAYGGGARLSRHDLDILLLESGANAVLDGLYIVNGEQHLDNHTTVEHRAAATHSDQMYKGVLRGASRAVFNGKVLIREGAPQSAAGQLNKNLLLSSDAEIDTKPELQIDTDDVKCSHGAAIGRLDADEIFYLQSRGLDATRAEIMLTHAFAADVVKRFGQKSVEDRLLKLAEEALA